MGPHQFWQMMFSKMPVTYLLSHLLLTLMVAFMSSPPWTFWLLQMTEDGRSDDMWLLSLAYKNAVSFHFVLLGYLLLKPSCHTVWQLWRGLCSRNQGPWPTDLAGFQSNNWYQLASHGGEPCEGGSPSPNSVAQLMPCGTGMSYSQWVPPKLQTHGQNKWLLLV